VTKNMLTHPLAPLAMLGVIALILLSFPLRLPMGANYWDLYTYVDTAYRVSIGQLPHVDFFVPVGALGYGLYIVITKFFPEAHTLLAVQYCILLIALPLMIVIVLEASKRSKTEALCLAIPFAFFALLPINGIELYPSPGFDGFGNYNRHVALLLYVLAAAVLFVDHRGKVSALAMIILVSLFMIKITGFVVAFVFVIHAALAGRLSWRVIVVSIAVSLLALGFVEWRMNLISAYITDIIELVSMNTGYLLPRILTVLSGKFNVVAPAAALILLLLWHGRKALVADIALLLREGKFSPFQNLLNAKPIWLLSLLLAGTVFETQNTGSHEYILIWPALLLLLRDIPLPWQRKNILVLTLIATTALPTPLTIAHRAARSIISAPGYEALNAPLLGPIARVSVKPDIMRQSRAMLAHYPMARTSYEQFANRGVLPSYILFSEIDYQVSWLVSIEQAATAILAYEQDNKKFFKKIVTLDFVDPLPVVLKRLPLRDMSIGNDPTRTLAKLGAHAIAEIASADAILLPQCPVTEARNAIANAYAPSLQGRRVVAITPCFKMLVKD
jgi:hypothetical protein